MPPPPPRVWALQVSICAFAAGAFAGGGGLKNQLKKVAIGVDATCLASNDPDSETNVQGAVATFKPSNPSFTGRHNHVVFPSEVVL
jgi:hypothetical protein